MIVFDLCLMLMSTAIGQAGEIPKLDEKQVVRILEPYFQAQAEKYEFFLDDAKKQKLTLTEKPVMRWTAEGNLGAVWVWTSQGRAELIGCLGAYVNGSGQLEAFHEFHSLTRKPLQQVAIGNIRTWESNIPGVKPTLLTDAPEPASNERLRLVQMRAILREFTAELQSGKQTHQLRLTTTPLFRFNSTNPDVLDGAIFSFLLDNGTDPEVLIMIESIKTAEGQRWHYSPIRFSWREVWVRHRDKEVWRVPLHEEFWKSTTLRDNYVTCSMGQLDVNAIGATQKATP